MALVPTTPRREFIFIYGPDKGGKTTCYFTIASYVADDVNFFIADGDMAYWANAEEFPTLNHDKMHVNDDLMSWTDYVQWAEDSINDSKPGDWLVIDRVDTAREMALAYWIEEVHGEDSSAWYLAKSQELAEKNEKRRKRGDGEVGIQTEIDWQTINNFYYQWFNRINTRAKGRHIFLTSSAKETVDKGGWSDNKRTLQKFGGVGMKPGGGTGLPAIPSTILYLGQFEDRRELTTIGDRGRERKHKLVNAKFNDFVTSYLIPVGKWKVE